MFYKHMNVIRPNYSCVWNELFKWSIYFNYLFLIRQAWGSHMNIRDSHLLAIAAAEGQFLDSDYEDYAAANTSSIACLRSVALIVSRYNFWHLYYYDIVNHNWFCGFLKSYASLVTFTVADTLAFAPNSYGHSRTRDGTWVVIILQRKLWHHYIICCEILQIFAVFKTVVIVVVYIR